MKTNIFTIDRPALAGMLLLAVPAAFWIALIFELVFSNPFLMNSVFITIDNISPLLTILLLVVLPLIALAWNFFHIVRFGFRLQDGEFTSTLTVQTKLINMGVIISAAVNIGLIVLYAFMENFNVTLR
jgi:hypothetical protein